MILSMQYVELPNLLYRYFSLSGNVSIPGLGSLSIVRIPAVIDFSNKQLLPPVQDIKFKTNNSDSTPEQFNYIARLSGMNSEGVDNALKLLGEELTTRLVAERKLEWMDVGTFSVSDEGEIGFTPKNATTDFFLPVHYAHVIRADAEISIKVGEDEKTNTDMQVFFEDQRADAVNKKWQKAAMALVLFAALLLVSRFMFGSFDLRASRYNPLNFITPKETYRVI
jgi:hypothetical protein